MFHASDQDLATECMRNQSHALPLANVPLWSFKLDTHALRTKQWAAHKSHEWHVYLQGSSAPDSANARGLSGLWFVRFMVCQLQMYLTSQFLSDSAATCSNQTSC